MLGINNFIRLKIKDNTSSYALLYICNENDSTYETYELIADETYTIGKNNSQNICCPIEFNDALMHNSQKLKTTQMTIKRRTD